MSSFVLTVTIISSFGAVHTDRVGTYSSYQSCAEDAVGRIESMQPLYPDSRIKWECQRQ